jgi:hypothetical protein
MAERVEMWSGQERGYAPPSGYAFPRNHAGPDRGPVKDLPEFTCGACRETFGTNFLEEEIECAVCGARRCPNCEHWFGGES